MTSAPPHVAVHATAHRDVTPDRFEATVRVVCRKADAGAAAQGLTAGFAQVEDVLAALPAEVGITARRSGVSQQRVAWEGQRLEWIAGRSVELTSRDVERAGAVLGPFAALLDVVDDLELHGPSWHLDRDNPALGELQAEAVHAALARARRYAAALGATL
ncbi:MAG TPA: SIMPL domain-containing protein, partial [Jatrophihabitantaceae bacterium]